MARGDDQRELIRRVLVEMVVTVTVVITPRASRAVMSVFPPVSGSCTPLSRSSTCPVSRVLVTSVLASTASIGSYA
ncbi:hypothetical protein ColTof4_14336 [Colletotrichum tofieldiae]|nr:hypothetical protein ColTof3_14747 [Colletotrichum tofieldiae]GKT81913.1 hypothetical protein ColTof4_14336 [Colletotrichum tofieldiae]